jgi:ammonium transporter, Amt family
MHWTCCICTAKTDSVQISLNLGKRHLAIFQHVDDTLDVFHTHFVGSLVGGIGTGLFATSKGCAAFGLTNPGGAIDGNGRQVWIQIVSALFVIGWNLVWTSLIMIFIKYVLRVPLRMTDEACKIGDYAVHREESYTFAYYNRSLLNRRGAMGADDLEGGIHGIIMGRPMPEDPHHISGIPGKQLEANADADESISPLAESNGKDAKQEKKDA